MVEIIPPKITIDEFKINTVNLGKKYIDLSFGYTASVKGFSNKDRIHRKFELGTNVINFIMSTLNDIKRTTGTETAIIDKEDEMKEKLVNIMTRILQEVDDLAKVKDYDKYMKAFNRLNCYKVTFPEIVV
ncbi:MAG: hypothetical protein ACPLXC_02975 [Candidatus Pacearchaeota archaeon]